MTSKATDTYYCAACNSTGGHKEHCPCFAKTKMDAPYGYCPVCGEKGYLRERRIDGNDQCAKGHTYPSKNALKSKSEDTVKMTDAEEPIEHIYEWDTAFGIHRDLRCGYYNGEEPDRSYPVYRRALTRPAVDLGMVLGALKDYEQIIDKLFTADSTDTVGEYSEDLQRVAYKHRKIIAHLEAAGVK